jgi:GTP-binding protein
VSSIDYNEYVGRIGIGRVERGIVRAGQDIMVCNHQSGGAPPYRSKIVNLYEIEDLRRVPVDGAEAGSIVCFSGIENVNIGDTVCDLSCVEPLPFANISEPTVEMTFSVNDSPFAGKEGKFVTSRNLRDRLQSELLRDVSLRVNDTDSTESWNVSGRGEMHLSILMETMRREGYEFQVSTPRVLYKDIGGERHEPLECLICDVPESAVGPVMSKMGLRKGELRHMAPIGSRMRLEFIVPSRGLFGYRSEFLTDTRGEGIMSSVLEGYAPYKGDVTRRQNGSLIAFESGEAVTYGLHAAQERGILFISAGTPVYAGQIVGQNAKAEDMTVNVCKRKQLTNFRASGSDDALRLISPITMSMEQALEFLADDELLEITPKSLRLRKRDLNHELRMKKRKLV